MDFEQVLTLRQTTRKYLIPILRKYSRQLRQRPWPPGMTKPLI